MSELAPNPDVEVPVALFFYISMTAGNSGNANTDVQATTWVLPEDVEAMRDACLSEEIPTFLQDRNEALIAFLYDTGVRRGEAAALNTEHLNLDERTVYLSADIQKGSPGPATINLGEWGADSTRVLKRYLRDRWKDTEALFPSRSSDRITGRSIARVVKQAAVLADVSPQRVEGGTGEPEDITPHTLRHSVAYRIIQVENGRLEDVQLRLHHAKRATTDQIYSHLIPR